MRFSIASILALAATAVATPSDAFFGEANDKMQYVYGAVQTNEIIQLDIDVTIIETARRCNRNVNWGNGDGYQLRKHADDFCRRNRHRKIHGVWGCSKPCHGRIDERHCTRCDSGHW
ncbi:hypothetical protein QQS21_011555 [Conoideocrella luteorostrata]|uniref:Uncharacterized protein n=1 Tax=Conoideocrella luteorostrata TaxID=1105319 RepID=A0AAJ0CFP8_9HYPO|nr:hypothetical protein QQS21_011555 [Conoideocrella luteorostrata]